MASTSPKNYQKSTKETHPDQSTKQLTAGCAITPLRIKKGSKGKIAIIGRSMSVVRQYKKELEAQGYILEVFDGEINGKPVISHYAQDEFRLQVALYRMYVGDDEAMLPPAAVKETTLYKENKKWIEDKNSEGYTIIDLGNPENKKDASPFYDMEVEATFG